MKNPTLKQLEILNYLVRYARVELRQPTLQEIADAFGISKQAIRQHLLLLEKKGLIEYSDRGARNIYIADGAFDFVDYQ